MSVPLLIDIHGGGWMYGDKDLNLFYNQWFRG
jgi:acetyl esterase/lipase